MNITSLPSVEERVKTICDCRKGSMDDKQYEATVEYNLTQDRNQAYTRLVEGIEGMKTDERKVATFGEWQAESYEDKMLVNAILNDILENVVKPLYGKE